MKYLFFLYCFIENIYSMNNDNNQIVIYKKCLKELLSIQDPINFSLYFPKIKSDMNPILRLTNLCNNHPDEIRNFDNFLDTETNEGLPDSIKIIYKNIMHRIFHGD